MKERKSATLFFGLQLFVITHGWQTEDKFPAWVLDLASAINNSNKQPWGTEEVKSSIVSTEDDISDKELPTNFILFNWTERSNQPVDKEEIAGKLHAIIRKKFKNRNEKIDLCFIGHSRGCYLNSEVVKRIAAAGENEFVRFLRVVTLDPATFTWTREGPLSDNPGGIVDWTNNYFQLAGADYRRLEYPAVGTPLGGQSLDVNLTSIVKAWNGRTLAGKEKGFENHSEVHDWYHWTWDQKDEGDLKNTPYLDFDINKQRTTFFAEKKRGRMITRQRLYWTGPIAENFRGKIVPELKLVSGIGSNTQRIPTAMNDPEINKVKNGYLQLNSLKEWVSTGSWFTKSFSGGFTIEFTFQIQGRNRHSSADGLTLTILDANRPIPLPIGRVGGELGYGGLNGLAVAFDNFWNPEYGDPKVTNRTVSLRANGSPRWLEPFTPDLPEPVNSGNKFRVRVTVNDETNQINLRIYSFGADKVTTMTKNLPGGSIPRNKIIGFTSASGAGTAHMTIEDVILVPSQMTGRN